MHMFALPSHSMASDRNDMVVILVYSITTIDGIDSKGHYDTEIERSEWTKRACAKRSTDIKVGYMPA